MRTTMIRILALTMCMMADTGAGTGGGDPAAAQKGSGDPAAENAASETIADTLTGAGDARVENLSTIQDITKQSTACPGCVAHDVQFVTRAGITSLRCKICDAEVEPADQGEADSLAAYNKDVDKPAATE